MVSVRSYAICEPYSKAGDGRTAATAAVDTLWVQAWGVTPATTLPLQVKSAQLAFDSTWVPYVQGTIVVVQPASSLLAQVDPRNLVQVRFTLRQTIDGVTTDQPWNLMLRARSIDWLTGELTLTVASYDAQFSEYADGSIVDQAYGGEDLTTIIEGATPLINWPAGAFTSIPFSANPTFTKADQVWQPGVTLLDYLSQFQDIGNRRSFVDEAGNKWDTDVGWASDTSTHYLNDAAQIKDVADVISRDDPTWANYVVVNYQGQVTTATGGAQTASAAGTGANTGRKAIVVSKPGKKPSSGNAATKILNVAAARGRSLQVSAVADIVARPNQIWSVAYGDQSLSGKAQSVAFTLPEGTMQLLVTI